MKLKQIRLLEDESNYMLSFTFTSKDDNGWTVAIGMKKDDSLFDVMKSLRAIHNEMEEYNIRQARNKWDE